MDGVARLGVVIPYFGELPVYWPLTLATMGRNPCVTWYLVTDQQVPDPPDNVVVVPSTLDRVRERASTALGYDVALTSPYKLCDLKPSYGLVFEAELRDHDYWGYADVDVLWGDIWRHVGPAVEAGTERILTFGHLSLFRNTPEIRGLVTREVPGILPARTAYTTEQHLHYDEFGGWDALTRAAGLTVFAEPVYFDMYVASYRLRANRSRRVRGDSVFAWQDGRCLELDPRTGEVVSEAAYVHLQKRATRRPEVTELPEPPAALALGPVDIVRVEALPDAVRAVRSLERSVSSWIHWRRSYDAFRITRARRRLVREVHAFLGRAARGRTASRTTHPDDHRLRATSGAATARPPLSTAKDVP